MGRQDGINRIRHKEVCIFIVALMHVYYCMYFYYLLLFVLRVLLLDKLVDLPLHLSLSVIRCLAVELLYACQTVGLRIGK